MKSVFSDGSFMDDNYYEPYFKGTNFGSKEYTRIVREGMLKVACGYYNGGTLERILEELGYKNKNENTLTDKGQRDLYQLFEEYV